MGEKPRIDRAQLVERGRRWAQAHVGIWIEVRLAAVNATGGRVSGRRLCSRRIRVLEVYRDFALVEVQAMGCGSWRESLEYEVLGAQVRADQDPAAPCSPEAKPGSCGCVVRGNDVALCDEGRRLWSEAIRDRGGARAGYEEHLARAIAG